MFDDLKELKIAATNFGLFAAASYGKDIDLLFNQLDAKKLLTTPDVFAPEGTIPYSELIFSEDEFKDFISTANKICSSFFLLNNRTASYIYRETNGHLGLSKYTIDFLRLRLRGPQKIVDNKIIMQYLMTDEYLSNIPQSRIVPVNILVLKDLFLAVISDVNISAFIFEEKTLKILEKFGYLIIKDNKYEFPSPIIEKILIKRYFTSKINE